MYGYQFATFFIVNAGVGVLTFVLGNLLMFMLMKFAEFSCDVIVGTNATSWLVSA